MYFWWDEVKKHRPSQQMVTRHFLPTIFWLCSWAVFNSDAFSLLEFSLIIHFELAHPWFLRFISCTAYLFACTTCFLACTNCSHVHTWGRWLAHSGFFFAQVDCLFTPMMAVAFPPSPIDFRSPINVPQLIFTIIIIIIIIIMDIIMNHYHGHHH